ncbi:hypothetical protein [Burkholderia lata]|uniref:Glutathionylspermidine synthase pre-ATP-grasp-like domain-containing protein n=1 Tax=Burkholderia lata (strain ATCC 17760 / DSM 23089 / LMG 22485 / NCIMB 9086 / R18194 / 383) TaxID=482957 RepID=Q39G30_BURL3|nr:hypothetical protein [Burkholderia lata]ABB08586.1 hypothetical protein Bcep18194_A4992 [Burkholderia lata]
MSSASPLIELKANEAQCLHTDLGWHDALLAAYAEFGFCYEYGDIPIAPVLMEAAFLKQASHDLRVLMQLARAVSLAHLDDRAPIRAHDRSIVERYRDAERQPLMGRPDCILAGGKLRVLEFNMDSGMGGIQEVGVLTDGYLDSGLGSLLAYELQNPFESQLGFIQNQLTKASRQSVCITPLADFSRFYLDQSDHLAARISARLGVPARTVFPEALRQGEWLTDGQTEYGIFYRDACFLHEPILLAGMAQALNAARSTRTITLGDPLDIGVDDKGALALVSEFLDQQSQDDPELGRLKALVPWTRLMDRKVTTVDGEIVDLEKFVRAQKGTLVLKRCASHVGKQVFIGSRTDDAIWDDIISRTKMKRDDGEDWVVQRFVVADKFPLWFRDHDGSLGLRHCSGTAGPFVFGDQPDGWLVRIQGAQADDDAVFALPTDGNIGLTTVAAVDTLKGVST